MLAALADPVNIVPVSRAPALTPSTTFFKRVITCSFREFPDSGVWIRQQNIGLTYDKQKSLRPTYCEQA
jgi:hypothetical protein